MDFDIRTFRSTLLEEVSLVLPKIMDDLHEKKIYSVALYNSGDEWGYLFPTISTFSGLEQATNKYKEYEVYEGFSFQDIESILKWSPCDSPHHENYVDSMPRTAKLLLPIVDIMDSLYDEERDDWSKPEAFHQELVDACIDVLKSLDHKGDFGRGLAREQITINFLNGDQSDEERLERAQRLNSLQNCARLESEFSQAHEAHKRRWERTSLE